MGTSPIWLTGTAKGKNDQVVETGLKCDLRIVTAEFAVKSPVGQGRTDPNSEPFLPPPTGRLMFTLNPFAFAN